MKPLSKTIKRESDSFFTNLFARSVSVHITPFLAKTPITPIQVTIMGLVVGLLAAWFGCDSQWASCLIAAFLIEFSHILDCVDGELARITDRGNLFAAALDPISDRLKDMAIIYASYIQALENNIFNLSENNIASIGYMSIGLWLTYMYIVDSFLNPAQKKVQLAKSIDKKRIYLGLYDLFVYGSIIFLVLNLFRFFNLFILFLAITGIIIQIYRLKKIYNV